MILPLVRTLLILGLCFFSVAPVAAVGEDHGDPPAAISWTGLDGEETTLDELRGQVTIVNFWATWCAPCVEELTLFAKLHPNLEEKGIRLVAVSADALDETRQVRSFTKEKRLPFEILLGGTTDQMEALGLEPVLPGTVVLDAEGKVRARFSRVVTESDVENALASIAERPLLEGHDRVAHDDGGTPSRGDEPAQRAAETQNAKGRAQETASRVPS